jgi:hypothetical protein
MRLFTPFEGVASFENSGACLSAVIGNPRSPSSFTHWQSETRLTMFTSGTTASTATCEEPAQTKPKANTTKRQKKG